MLQPSSYWIAVQTLKASDGGILDSDDQLCDVADDREQVSISGLMRNGADLTLNGKHVMYMYVASSKLLTVRL